LKPQLDKGDVVVNKHWNHRWVAVALLPIMRC
jgi:hypothetical protein